MSSNLAYNDFVGVRNLQESDERAALREYGGLTKSSSSVMNERLRVRVFARCPSDMSLFKGYDISTIGRQMQYALARPPMTQCSVLELDDALLSNRQRDGFLRRYLMKCIESAE